MLTFNNLKRFGTFRYVYLRVMRMKTFSIRFDFRFQFSEIFSKLAKFLTQTLLKY